MKASEMTPDDYVLFFRKRLAQLRAEKGVSAREMSRSIGQNDSYINHIENGQTMPSISGFFIICDYLGVSPSDFLNPALMYPRTNSKLYALMESLPAERQGALVEFIISWDRNKN